MGTVSRDMLGNPIRDEGGPIKPSERNVIFEDDFSDGLKGWTGLIASGENFYPSLYPASLKGVRSMIVDTCGGVSDVTAYATKRAFAYRGIIRWTTRFTWSAIVNGVAAAGPEQNGLRYLRFAVDWQSGDETTGDRDWWEIRYRHWDENGAAITPIWEASDASANAYNAIASLAGYELGYNQAGKFDWHEIEIVFDTSTHKWISVTVDKRFVNLAAQTVGGVQSGVAEFDNGSNFILACQNRSNNSNSDPFMLVDYTKAEIVS